MGRRVNQVRQNAAEDAVEGSETQGEDPRQVNLLTLVEMPVNRVAEAQYVPPEQAALTAEPPKRYRVMKEQRYVTNGLAGLMPEGKILDSSQYDIDSVKAQGILLQEI